MKVIETRFTRETGKDPITFWPMGIMHSWTDQFQRFEIGHHNPSDAFVFVPCWNTSQPQWGAVLAWDQSPMYKFPMPQDVTLEYKTYRFVYCGIWYTLDIRLDFDSEQTEQRERLF